MAFAPTIALDYLRRAHDADRLAHAYLLVGEQAALDLAWQLASLVVPAPLNSVASHQDVHVVEPESKSRRIVVAQMRELEDALRLRASSVGGRKVGIVNEADRLQPQAANAFLKTLEEPPSASLLLLITAQPEALMETILSRCIKVVVQTSGGTDITSQIPEEGALREMLATHADGLASDSAATAIPDAYRLLREFTGLLSAMKGRLQATADKALEVEETRYAKTTDGAWLEEREAYHKSRTESQYVAQRARLVAVISRWWGDSLRKTVESPLAGDEKQTIVTRVLRRISVLDELRENLDRNIQEALALEVAFLQMFEP